MLSILAYFLHLIHFFNPETLNISRFSVYSASPKWLVAIKYKMWDGHLARQQARSLFHYLTIN